MATTIASLAVEILAEIFASTQSNHLVLSDRATAEENTHAAIAVSQVCHQWRAVALGLPKLWAYIAWGTHKAHRLPLLSAQIERCRGRPMLFYILCPADVATQILVHDSIAGHLWNAEQISVDDCTASMLTTIFTHDAPHLRSLHIRSPESSMIKLPAESQLPAKKFKSLKALALYGADVTSSNLIFKAESIVLADVRFAVHTFLHPSSSTLTTLSLLNNITVTDFRLDNPLVLPVLEGLCVMAHLKPPVLLAFDMPHLKFLMITASRKRSFTMFLSFLPISWALRPPTKLQVLAIHILSACGQEEDTVMQHSRGLELMFSVFSNVSHMRWSGQSWDALMELWGRRLGDAGEDGKAKMPNLQAIVLDKKESHAALVRGLAARRPELAILCTS
ncbi:hypothetical protein CYLTODRAFT_444565 [Cylindrobasidium torrendii FP15055 ss-10]|uniref:F-box domain-containing protein n=1 Tax=Cylindrobasidium torrendii FP15055 ss-10 TaxID=1314674 RepID=A0A0D7B8M7_9AGAR|nr:hypothetical protein CYLTODRAFT_444565 [Cylindrobasidium torrendii FP15055 ss-10]